MASAKSRESSRTIRINHPVSVKVTNLPIKYFASLRNLDLEKVAKASAANVELGLLRTGCGEQIVHAVLRKGRVTEVRVAPCKKKKESRPLSPEMQKIFAAAQKRIPKPKRSAGGRLPMPVKRFFSQAALLRINAVIVCYQFCSMNRCIDCCYNLQTHIWFCGTVWIDTTSGPYVP